MKTSNFFLIAALCCALLTGGIQPAIGQSNEASETIPTPTTYLQVNQTKLMQFRVTFFKPQSPRITIQILDSQENVLFRETRGVETSYVRYFDLSPLLDGRYTFEVIDGKEKYNQSFDIMTQTRRIVAAQR